MANPRLSDEEKKRRGTFRADQSEEVYRARAAQKVVTGSTLSAVPDPEMPLNEIGLGKYRELTELLLSQGKLTKITCMDCEMIALHWQNVRARVATGKSASSDSLKQITAITQRLRIAEDAPEIESPDKKSRFTGCGFAYQRSTPYRVRTSPPAVSGEL